MTLPAAVVCRPISFVTPLVQAILQGRKTQTRRLIAPQPDCVGIDSTGETVGYANGKIVRCKFGRPGDQLWVRERWTDQLGAAGLFASAPSGVVYAADMTSAIPARWKPARFMPRRHSRLTLKVDAIRIERLTRISADDAKAEGFNPATDGNDPIDWFKGTWNALSDEASNWSADPLVWVVQFHVTV